MISTAGEGRCISLSDAVDMLWPTRSGAKPGKHCESNDGARIIPDTSKYKFFQIKILNQKTN
ncbi:hypothetical protein HanPSC8_Chr07g0270811 [Helianthus annuus]|nr:hypothetical protein HanPSC8_Chr07g0270811 [Helianthus annuus]